MQALEGIRILDATRLLPGALATQYLADFGADVIKIEQPGTGDYARHLFAAGGESAVFTATNGGKRSIAIDLKRPEGREALLALARTADVLIEGFRPGVMERLGLGFDTLHHVNSRLIYLALTGYGQTGPLRGAAGHDINYMAVSGALDLIGAGDGGPAVANVQIADVAGGGMQTAMGVLLALAARSRTGEGQFVDVGMTRGAANLTALPRALFRATGDEPRRGQGILSGEYACYSVYRCRDERYVAAGALEPKFWRALCGALGRPELIGDQFAPERQFALKQELAQMFQTKNAADWATELEPHDCCVTLVRTVSESAACDWLRVDGPAPGLSATPGIRARKAPALGEHTREVLREAGVPDAEVDAWFGSGAVA
jgi:alpha-methylacyl-CoA racemase